MRPNSRNVGTASLGQLDGPGASTRPTSKSKDAGPISTVPSTKREEPSTSCCAPSGTSPRPRPSSGLLSGVRADCRLKSRSTVIRPHIAQPKRPWTNIPREINAKIRSSTRAFLTAPIVKHALQPAFERLGPDATPDQVLDLKVCDPAMGSGAFLVEACRAIGRRLVKAWERWPDTRPKIPADEDEELHASRLVAQRCLYGVDKNPRAVDLARLSLWLATLAKDLEFTFLDHAMKCGDSVVGLTVAQIAAANWDEFKPGLPLFRRLVKDTVAEAMKARAEIRAAPDDTLRAVQEERHRTIEDRLTPVRTIGDAVISAFFAADKPKGREKERAKIESWLAGGSLQDQWEKLKLQHLRCARENIQSLHSTGRSNFPRFLRGRTQVSMQWLEIPLLREKTP